MSCLFSIKTIKICWVCQQKFLNVQTIQTLDRMPRLYRDQSDLTLVEGPTKDRSSEAHPECSASLTPHQTQNSLITGSKNTVKT